jgi:hypothetical protein
MESLIPPAIYAVLVDHDLQFELPSTLYDTVSDRYAQFLRDEILAEVEARYHIRKTATAARLRDFLSVVSARSMRPGKCRSSSAAF